MTLRVAVHQFAVPYQLNHEEGNDSNLAVRELLRHAKVSTTLDLYFRAIDAAKLEAQEEIALAIRSSAAAAD